MWGMLFGFEFAIGVMLAFVVVPLAIFLLFKAAKVMRAATQTWLYRVLGTFALFAVVICWVVLH